MPLPGTEFSLAKWLALSAAEVSFSGDTNSRCKSLRLPLKASMLASEAWKELDGGGSYMIRQVTQMVLNILRFNLVHLTGPRTE